jgi:hypothetical protein
MARICEVLDLPPAVGLSQSTLLSRMLRFLLPHRRLLYLNTIKFSLCLIKWPTKKNCCTLEIYLHLFLTYFLRNHPLGQPFFIKIGLWIYCMWNRNGKEYAKNHQQLLYIVLLLTCDNLHEFLYIRVASVGEKDIYVYNGNSPSLDGISKRHTSTNQVIELAVNMLTSALERRGCQLHVRDTLPSVNETVWLTAYEFLCVRESV